jgi:hypothetical protein
MDPDDLLSDAALDSAVGALASRNAHHFTDMDEGERTQALAHWRALAVDVLTAARAVVAGEHGGAAGHPSTGEGPGRAVIVFEDGQTEDEVQVHVSFYPELEEIGPEQVAGTPAQLTAMALLQNLAEASEGEQPA